MNSTTQPKVGRQHVPTKEDVARQSAPTLGPNDTQPSSASTLLDDIADHTSRVFGPELFVPKTEKGLFELARMYYRAGLLTRYLPYGKSDNWTNEQKFHWCTSRAMVVFLTGADLGLLPHQAIRGIYFVEDQPSPAAKLLAGVIKKHRDVCEYWNVEEQSDSKCHIVTKRVGAKKEESLIVTLDQFAKIANEKNSKGGFKRPPWQLYPSRMLLARCTSWLGNAVYPDLTLGLYAAEEMSASVYERVHAGIQQDRPGVAHPTDADIDAILNMTAGDGEAQPEPPSSDPAATEDRAVALTAEELAWLDRSAELAGKPNMWYMSIRTQFGERADAVIVEAKRRVSALLANQAREPGRDG